VIDFALSVRTAGRVREMLRQRQHLHVLNNTDRES